MSYIAMNTYSIPLFPLPTVICPDGILPLKIYEARYLDMVKACLRGNNHFGVVTVLPEGSTDREGDWWFGDYGTVVKIIDADVPTPGLMTIRAQGLQRIHIKSFDKEPDGLIMGFVEEIPNDLPLSIPDDLKEASIKLDALIQSLPRQGIMTGDIPFISPYKLDECGWVADRWVELLEIPLIDKHRLMQLESPVVRLELVLDILEAKDPKAPEVQ